MAFIAELSRLRELPLTDDADAALAAMDTVPGLEDIAAAPIGAEGRIDFGLRATELGAPFDALLHAGRRYQRAPTEGGGWALLDEGTGDIAVVGQPTWLLEALMGVTRAIPTASETSGALTRYECDVDLFIADERSAVGLAPLPVGTVRDLRSVRLDASLYGDGKLCRIEFSAGDVRTSLELFDFGGPPPIELDVQPATPVRPSASGASTTAHTAVETVRSSTALTAAARTASFTHLTTGSKLAEVIAGASSDEVMEGRVDFATRACLTTDPHGMLFGDGRLLGQRADGNWFEMDVPPGGPPTGGVLWLLDLPGGVVSATPAGREEVAGGAGERYECVVDLAEADRRTPNGLAIPSVGTVGELRALPATIWVDAEGRARKVAHSSGGTSWAVELDELGTSPPVEFPF